MNDIKADYFRIGVAAAVFVLSVAMLIVYAMVPDLRDDDTYKALLTVMIVNAFAGGVVAYAFAAKKTATDDQANINTAQGNLQAALGLVGRNTGSTISVDPPATISVTEGPAEPAFDPTATPTPVDGAPWERTDVAPWERAR